MERVRARRNLLKSQFPALNLSDFWTHPAKFHTVGEFRVLLAHVPHTPTRLAEWSCCSGRIHWESSPSGSPVPDGIGQKGFRRGDLSPLVRDVLAKCSRAAKCAKETTFRANLPAAGNRPAQFRSVGVLKMLPDRAPRISTRPAKMSCRSARIRWESAPRESPIPDRPDRRERRPGDISPPVRNASATCFAHC